jgi:uncharacterized protein YqgC (DUF456 family)
MFWDILAVFLLVGFCLAGLAGIVLGLPGTLLILGAAAAYGWATGFELVTFVTLAWLAAMALAGEGLEFAATAAAVSGKEPSRRVTVGVLVGAFVGGLAGAPFFFGLGSLPGALLGAFAAAALAVASEGGTGSHALSTGLAALRGRLVGFILKGGIAVAMILVVLTTIF